MTTRAEFLAERAKGLGGSEAAAALNLDIYTTPRELYGVKTGELTDDFSDNRFTRAGRVLESAIADLFAEQFGVVLRKKPTPVVHPKYAFMRGNLDRTIVGQRAVLEIKNCDAIVHRMSGEWGEAETDQVPVRYLVQVAHYLAITGYEVGYLGVLVGGNNLLRYVIERDSEFETMVIDGEAAFWSHVERREPPPLDYAHPSTYGLLRKLFPGSDGRIIALPPEAEAWHAQLLEAREREKVAKAEQDNAKSHILEVMAGATIGQLASGGEYRYSKVLRKAYEVAETEYTTLRYATKQTRIKEVV